MASGLRLGENWDDVPKFSVILSGTRDGGPYKREDFLAGLAGIIGNVSTRVLSFGPLARNSEWYLVLQDKLSKDRMLLAGTILAKGVSFGIRSADKSQFVVRVHWAPPFVPTGVITKFLDSYGTVVSVAFDKCTSKGFEGVATGVRSVVMTGNPKDVPHVMTVCHPKTNHTFEFLLTVRGRKPLCLRCRHEGHYRRDCFTPFCRHHGEYGHTTESCSAAKSYASAARPNSTTDADREDQFPENEGSEEMATEESETAPIKVSDTPPAATRPAVSEPGDAAMATAVEDSAPSAVEPSSGGVLSDSDDASSEGGDTPQWQLVAGSHKRKREGPLAPKPTETRPLPPAEPKLGRLVIADDDPDPKVLRQNSSGSESESSV